MQFYNHFNIYALTSYDYFVLMVKLWTMIKLLQFLELQPLPMQLNSFFYVTETGKLLFQLMEEKMKINFEK